MPLTIETFVTVLLWWLQSSLFLLGKQKQNKMHQKKWQCIILYKFLKSVNDKKYFILHEKSDSLNFACTCKSLKWMDEFNLGVELWNLEFR